MRDDDPGRFLHAVRDIPGSTDVRYYLQHLTLQLLGHLADPRPQEVDLVAGLLIDPFWRDMAANQVVAVTPRGFKPWMHPACARSGWGRVSNGRLTLPVSSCGQ